MITNLPRVPQEMLTVLTKKAEPPILELLQSLQLCQMVFMLESAFSITSILRPNDRQLFTISCTYPMPINLFCDLSTISVICKYGTTIPAKNWNTEHHTITNWLFKTLNRMKSTLLLTPWPLQPRQEGKIWLEAMTALTEMIWTHLLVYSLRLPIWRNHWAKYPKVGNTIGKMFIFLHQFLQEIKHGHLWFKPHLLYIQGRNHLISSNFILLYTFFPFFRHHGRVTHKQCTIEVILKSKMGGNYPHSASSVAVEVDPASGTVYSHAHKFEKNNFTTPTSCDVCHSLLWGPRTGLRYVDLIPIILRNIPHFHNHFSFQVCWLWVQHSRKV